MCCVHCVVPVNDAPAVEVVKRLHDTTGVEAGGGVIEVTAVPDDNDDDANDDDDEEEDDSPEDGPELSTKAGLHEHVEELPVLEGLKELDDEAAVGLLHDLLLGHDVLLLPRLHDLALLHLLQGETAVLAVTRDHHQLHPRGEGEGEEEGRGKENEKVYEKEKETEKEKTGEKEREGEEK